jgi:aryl-alcohol dehydrogenase-like predicted oxidoreductase
VRFLPPLFQDTQLIFLSSEGKIKHIGLSEVSSSTLLRAFKIAPVACVQLEYSAFCRHIETPASTNILATCRSLGASVVAYSPLGRGLLTGSITSRSALESAKDPRGTNMPWFFEDNISANVEIVTKFKELAKKKGCEASQLALAWLLAQGEEDVIPIPGTKKVGYLESNWGAREVRFEEGELEEVTKFTEENSLKGERAIPRVAAMSFLETKEMA